jgi:hypothetical protein
MSHPIYGPPPQPYPYQGCGGLQQQAYATMAPSSSGLGEDLVMTVAVGAAGILLGAGGLMAYKHFGTNSTEKAESPQRPPAPVKNAQTYQVPSEPTEESQPSQTGPAPTKPTLPSPQPEPQPQPKHIDGKDELGIHREQQERKMCGKHSLNTVLVHFGLPPITTAEYLKAVPEPTADIFQIIGLANDRGLRVMIAQRDLGAVGEIDHTSDHEVSQLKTASIELDRITEAEAFIIHYNDHFVALVNKAGYNHLSDSLDQQKREKYPATTKKACAGFQKRHNVKISAVLSFRK